MLQNITMRQGIRGSGELVGDERSKALIHLGEDISAIWISQFALNAVHIILTLTLLYQISSFFR